MRETYKQCSSFFPKLVAAPEEGRVVSHLAEIRRAGGVDCNTFEETNPGGLVMPKLRPTSLLLALPLLRKDTMVGARGPGKMKPTVEEPTEETTF